MLDSHFDRLTLAQQELVRAAATAMETAYNPYSHFYVGCALRLSDGTVITGSNVENAAYGVALCAECGLISSLISTGGGKLVAVSCVDRHGNALMPCGRCRQLLWEHGGPNCLLDSVSGIKSMTDILPDAFGAHDLTDRL